ncbi:MAG TPA: YetF domain-containing protein [Candidatus Binatia bacterium]|nr:YetF domain-containing protein [Candidatus Binatia bacterium]
MDATMWKDMFELGVPLAEKILRPLFVYVFLVVGLRLAGKRELAQLNPFDLVVLLTLSNTVQNAIIGDDNTVVGGVIGATALLGINSIVVRFVYRHEGLERLVEGDSDVLIEGGRIRMDRLRKELITVPELESAAHKQGIASLDEVERAVLEPSGTISFFARKPTPEVERHAELLARLDALHRDVAALRAGGRPA